MDGPVHRDSVYGFDGFQLDPIGRTLTRGGTPVKLAARLFDTLLYLIEHHDRLVPRDELLRAVWPSRTVEETSLGMAISSLRAALRDNGAAGNLIVTAPGRGYRFGARVTIEPLAGAAQPQPASAPPRAPLPLASPAAAPRRRMPWAAATLSAALIAAAFLVWRPLRHSASPPPAAPPPHSVAVLPFDNMSGDPAETYFADGLSEELIDALGRVAALRVAARVSSFSFRGTPVTIADIARRLNVGAILEGSLRRDGTRVRIAVRLVDGATGYQIWQRSYDRDQGDMLALEGQIAEAVIASLKVVLLGDAAARLTPGGTTNPRAYDAYLAGLPNISEDNDDAHIRAIEAFSTAIRLDPGFALAYAQRARALGYRATNTNWTRTDPTQRWLEAALQDAEKAVALAPDLGEAHAALAFVLKSRLSDLARAGADYARAVELSPGNASILMRYALFQLMLGHTATAVEAARHAADLDPLTPDTYRLLARVQAYAGHFDDAAIALRRAHTLLPASAASDRQTTAFVEMWHNDVAGALRTCGGGLDFRDEYCLAWAYHKQGRLADADRAMAKAQADVGDNGAYIYSNPYAQWGRIEDALHWLRIAYRLRDPGLIELRVDPIPDNIRALPDYQDVQRKLGLPP